MMIAMSIMIVTLGIIVLLLLWGVVGVMDGLTHGGLWKGPFWQKVRKLLWNNG